MLENVVNSFAREATAQACTSIGNIFKRKAKLLRRIQDIQKSDNYYHSSFLRNLEKDLLADFNLILKMEEDCWKLKSRGNWLNEGDVNTKFFHTTTIIRRKENRIATLRMENNSYIYDQGGIITQTYDFFNNLLQSNHQKYLKVNIPKGKICLSEVDKGRSCKNADRS